MDQPDDLAAALDNHQVTDDSGQIVGETTPQADSATLEQIPVDESATAEKSAGEADATPVAEAKSENEPEMVETARDETGKRYVPEDRFKQVYAKWKEAERKAKVQGVNPPPRPVVQPTTVDRTEALEIELLRTNMPQFNPESPEYNKEVDELGWKILNGSKDASGKFTITRLDAAREAIQTVKKITSKLADVKLEARTVKAQQSDQGITNRVLTREGTKPDPMKMTLEEKEEWLKANGLW